MRLNYPARSAGRSSRYTPTVVVGEVLKLMGNVQVVSARLIVTAVVALILSVWPGVKPALAQAGGMTEEEQKEIRLFLRRYWTDYQGILKPVEIFDPRKGEQVSQVRRASVELTEQARRTRRWSLADIRNLTTYQYDLEGTSEQEMLTEARVRALKSAAARLYFDDNFLVGRDLLESYLKRVGEQFIAQTTVLDRQYLAGNKMGLKVRLSVNTDLYYQDLRDKRFVADPNLRPIIAVHLQELVGDKPDTSAGGRSRIEQTLHDNLLLVYSKYMSKPPLDVDLTSAPNLLEEARLEAQRQDVDVLITGRLAIHPIMQEEIFYDPYTFENADLSLEMIRVDTGEVLDKVQDSYSAAGSDAAVSIGRVLDSMVIEATKRIAEKLRETWKDTMLLDGNYRLMISGVSPEEVATIGNLLKTISPKLSVYQKAYFGDVAVLNIVCPDVTPEQIEQFLLQTTEPQFSVRRVDKHRWELVVL